MVFVIPFFDDLVKQFLSEYHETADEARVYSSINQLVLRFFFFFSHGQRSGGETDNEWPRASSQLIHSWKSLKAEAG